MKQQIGPYDVTARLNFQGPIVWTDVYKDHQETRRTDFANVNVEPVTLPQRLTPTQVNLLAIGILCSLFEEFIQPELNRRYGVTVSEYDFLIPLEWQTRVWRVLIVEPASGLPTVS